MKKYHYTECGLNNIYLINGFELIKSGDEEEIFIHDIHGLHKAIGMFILQKKGILLGEEIKFMRTSMDFSQSALAVFLGCSYQSVLAWEKNKTPISTPCDRLLRLLFLEYLEPKRNIKIKELIDEIANLEAEMLLSKLNKVEFEETHNEWQLVA